MNGVSLQFFVHESRRVHGVPIYRWLLETAESLGLHGGTAFKSIASFGRHGVLHEEHFFELAGDVPIMVTFLVGDEEAEKLLARIRTEGLPLFYVRQPAEFGVVNGHET